MPSPFCPRSLPDPTALSQLSPSATERMDDNQVVLVLRLTSVCLAASLFALGAVWVSDTLHGVRYICAKLTRVCPHSLCWCTQP